MDIKQVKDHLKKACVLGTDCTYALPFGTKEE
jgi:hypothetical protein